MNPGAFENRGPFVQIATICEQVITENSGAITLFRIVSGFGSEGDDSNHVALDGEFVLKLTGIPEAPETEYPETLSIRIINGRGETISTIGELQIHGTPELLLKSPLSGIHIPKSGSSVILTTLGARVLSVVRLDIEDDPASNARSATAAPE